MKHKKLFITLTVVFSVLLALIIFFMIWFWGDRYDDFKDFRSEVAISGLKDGACPQGITVYRADKITLTDDNGNKEELPKQNYFFISAYFKNQASRIYVVGDETGEVGYVTLKNEDESDHTGHVGGIATNGRFLWVSSGSDICVAKSGTGTNNNIAIDLIKAAKENGSVQFTTSFKANCNASFLYFYDSDDNGAAGTVSTTDYLYVGEFYRDGNYKTNEKHHLTTKSGETNRAFAYEYRVTTPSDSVYGLATSDGIDKDTGEKVPKIQKIFSIPNEIQGFARTKKGIVLSASYGLKNSHIYYHEFNWDSLTENSARVKYTEIGKGTDKNKLYEQGFEYDGATKASGAPYYDTSVYVYYVDSSTMLNDYSIPSMSEGLCTLNGRVYVLFESGAKKYRTFVRTVLSNVYSFVPRKENKI